MMMRSIMVLMLIASTNMYSQILDPIEWSTKVEKVSDTEYDLVITAVIDANWHIYSQSVPKDGPFATMFIFEGNKNYVRKGNTKEEKGHTMLDPIFQMEIKYFEDRASFRQRIKLLGNRTFKINGSVEFMVCDDRRCLPPTLKDLEFTIPL